MKKLNKISSNTTWYLFFTGVKTLSTLAAVTLISRYLSPTSFGAFNFLLSIFLYSTVFDSLAHPQVVKKIYLGESPPKNFIKTLYIFSLILSIFAFIALLITGWFIVEKELLIPFIILLSGVLFKAFIPLSYIYDAHLQSKISSFSLCASTLISQGAAVTVVLNNASFNLLCLSYALQPLLYSLFLVLFRSKIPQPKRSLKNSPLKETISNIFKASAPLFTAALFIQAISRIDAIMIKQLLSYKSYGFFSIAVRLTDPWVLISSAVCISIFPLLIKLHKENKLTFSKNLFKYNTILIGFSLAICLPVILISKTLILLLFGESYTSSSEVLNIYIWSLPFLFMHNLQSIWEVINGLQTLFIYRAIFACTVNIVLNYFLIPLWGINGAAIATVCAYMSLTLVSSALNSRLRPYLKIQFNLFSKEA